MYFWMLQYKMQENTRFPKRCNKSLIRLRYMQPNSALWIKFNGSLADLFIKFFVAQMRRGGNKSTSVSSAPILRKMQADRPTPDEADNSNSLGSFLGGDGDLVGQGDGGEASAVDIEESRTGLH